MGEYWAEVVNELGERLGGRLYSGGSRPGEIVGASLRIVSDSRAHFYWDPFSQFSGRRAATLKAHGVDVRQLMKQKGPTPPDPTPTRCIQNA